MEHVNVDSLPELNDPVAIVAFAGWNDAAGAATGAARFFVRRLAARRFASIAPGAFYDFRESQPVVRVGMGGERSLAWPRNEFFYARNPVEGGRDFVIAIGVEPNLRWRTFSGQFEDLFHQLGVRTVVTLGALVSQVLHHQPIEVFGSADDPELAERLSLQSSSYQGPTGIVGVLNTVLRDSGMATASLWASVPHYVSTNRNPPATLSLLTRLVEVIETPIDMSELERASARFVDEVDDVVGADPELREYVGRLEEIAEEEEREQTDGGGSLPAAHDLVVDIEAFLREQRPGDPEPDA